MAEGRLNSERLSSGSDSSYDFYCQVCKDDGINVEANGFCVSCEEYLCDVCYKSHQRTRQTRNHELLGKDNMPRDTPLPADPVNRSISTMCKHHADRTVEFYCKVHDILGCSVCFATVHKHCSIVESILETSEGIYDSHEYVEFIQTLTSMKEAARDMITKARANTNQVKNCYSGVLKSVTMLKKEVIEALDKLERDIIAEADTLVADEDRKTESTSNTCSLLTENIETILSEFQSIQSSQRVCQTYISMKNSVETIKTMQDKVRDMEASLTSRTFRFEPNSQMPVFMKSPHALGKISTNVQGISVGVQPKTKTHAPMKPTHVGDINVRSMSDTNDPVITGSAVVSSNRMVIVDNKNWKVKLLDTQINELISELKTPNWPWDIAAISSTQAAVTLQSNKKILLLGVSDKLRVDREINVDGCCRGVAYSKGMLVVSCYNLGKVVIMDLYGSVVKRIETDSTGHQLFQCSDYVCVSKDGDIIYVSDSSSNRVTSLTLGGVVKSVYSDNDLKNPQKICVDHHGNLYICCEDSRNIHMLTADLDKIKIILAGANGLDNDVLSVSYCQYSNRLYVGMLNKKHVKVFQFA